MKQNVSLSNWLATHWNLLLREKTAHPSAEYLISHWTVNWGFRQGSQFQSSLVKINHDLFSIFPHNCTQATHPWWPNLLRKIMIVCLEKEEIHTELLPPHIMSLIFQKENKSWGETSFSFNFQQQNLLSRSETLWGVNRYPVVIQS